MSLSKQVAELEKQLENWKGLAIRLYLQHGGDFKSCGISKKSLASVKFKTVNKKVIERMPNSKVRKASFKDQVVITIENTNIKNLPSL